VIGDSGYVDILLQVGIVGLAALTGVLLWAVAAAVRTLRRERGMTFAAPLILTTYMLVANVTLSYFLEKESFTWIAWWSVILAAVRREGDRFATASGA
jgi:O-antigen ligase